MFKRVIYIYNLIVGGKIWILNVSIENIRSASYKFSYKAFGKHVIYLTILDREPFFFFFKKKNENNNNVYNYISEKKMKRPHTLVLKLYCADLV